MADIGANLKDVKERIVLACHRAGRSPEEVTVIAVTKDVPPSLIIAAHGLGLRHFGENRVQEAEPKIEELSWLAPRPTWHVIGRLQRNKVRTSLRIFDMLHSLDSIRLAETVSHTAPNPFPTLLQVNVAGEATKGGFSPDKLEPALEAIARLPNLKVTGLMAMAPINADDKQLRSIFRKLRSLRDAFGLEHLSMGMTRDFEIAVEEGATMVRIGHAIFEGR